MASEKENADFKTYLEELIQGSVPINTAFKNDIAIKLITYAKDKGLSKPQDVIRLAVSFFLTKEGYISK